MRAIPGVADAARALLVDAADSFRLGEPLRLIAYPGDHTRFEAPPLAEGRRLRGPGEAEVGVGLADALGLRPGVDARGPAAGRRARCASASAASCAALENDGRLAYVRPRPAARRRPDARLEHRRSTLAPGRRPRGGSTRGCARSARRRSRAGAATTRNARASSACWPRVLRGVGLAVGLVCLYALVQALAMTARERRGAVALLRACGGDARTVAAVLGGRGARRSRCRPRSPASRCRRSCSRRWSAAWRPASPSCRWRPAPARSPLVAGGLAALAAAATALVARRAMREPVVAGLREE